MFDIKNNHWYIETPTQEVFKIVSEWLRQHGLDWQHNDKDCQEIRSNAKYITNSRQGTISKYLMWGSNGQRPDTIAKEIKLNFKIMVDSVVYPEVESPQQKQIRELEETIQKATQQIEQLKKGM
jgi:hypothetical protein